MSVCANPCATGLTKRAQFRLSALGQTVPGLWPEEGEKIISQTKHMASRAVVLALSGGFELGGLLSSCMLWCLHL